MALNTLLSDDNSEAGLIVGAEMFRSVTMRSVLRNVIAGRMETEEAAAAVMVINSLTAHHLGVDLDDVDDVGSGRTGVPCWASPTWIWIGMMTSMTVNNNMARHVVVIGAGIVGASIAWRVASRGARVTIVDRAEPGSGASSHSFAWINAGAKEPVGYHNLNRRSLEMWPRFADALGEGRWSPLGRQARLGSRNRRLPKPWSPAWSSSNRGVIPAASFSREELQELEPRPEHRPCRRGGL